MKHFVFLSLTFYAVDVDNLKMATNIEERFSTNICILVWIEVLVDNGIDKLL